MVLILACLCPNGHTIVATVVDTESDTPPTEAELDGMIDAFAQETEEEIRAGKMLGECPYCGARPPSWGIQGGQVKDGVTAAQIAARMADEEAANYKDAMAAMRRRKGIV